MEDTLKLILEELKELRTGQKELREIVDAIRHRQEETDAKLDSLSMDVHKIHGELSSIKSGQERHEKILVSLSMRSLEQETEIRDLQKASTS